MSQKSIARLAWTLCGLVILITITSFYIEYAIPQKVGQSPPSDIFFAILVVVYVVIGALIVSNQPRNTVGWLMITMAVSTNIISLVELIITRTNIVTDPAPFALLVFVWLYGWSWWLLIGPILLIFLVFPNGKLPSPRWRWAAGLLAFCFLYFIILVSLSKKYELIGTGISLNNPWGLLSEKLINQLLFPFQFLLMLSAIACFLSMFVRYRNGTTLERTQIKWVFYASTFFAIVYPLGIFMSNTSIFNVLFTISIVAIPAMIGAAILRYHLWDIDIIIRRTLSYAVLTGLLALIYLGGVTLLQSLFTLVIGQQSPAAVVISTLLIAALFNPLRRRIQAAIDRRFYRQKYNAQKAIQTFIQSARAQTDPAVLTNQLAEIVQKTLEPESISLWIREKK